MIFSKMRRQKYIFDFKFGISVKFRVDWCIRLYDSYLICQYSLYFVHIHAYANMDSRENVGKFEVNHIVLYINRREILRWFRIWSQKNIFAYAFSRKSRFKNLRGRIQNFWIFLSLPWNSDSKYTHISGNYISQALESLMCQKLKMLHNFWLMDQKLFSLGLHAHRI